MVDYISRDAALDASKIVYMEYIELDDEGYEEGNADDVPVVFKRDIETIPAADVRPVVRCGECKYCVEHYDTDGNAPYWVCKEWDGGTDYDGFCYHGEKKGR